MYWIINIDILPIINNDIVYIQRFKKGNLIVAWILLANMYDLSITFRCFNTVVYNCIRKTQINMLSLIEQGIVFTIKYFVKITKNSTFKLTERL